MASQPLFDDAQEKYFHAAVLRGDLPVVQRCLELPKVRESVALWNAIHRATRLGEPAPAERSYPWYGGSSDSEDTIFAAFVNDDRHVELFRWLFAREQFDLFGETLRAYANSKLDSCIYGRDHGASREIFDCIVNSALFQQVFNDNERLQLLGGLLNVVAWEQYSNWIDVLLSYGADSNFAAYATTPLTALISTGNSKSLEILLAHGAWLESNILLRNCANHRPGSFVGELLRRGADANASEGIHGSVLHHAATRCLHWRMRQLIHKGFADVDARDSSGRTPIMVVGNDYHHANLAEAVVETMGALLEAGASVHAVDKDGRGVLHHTVSINPLDCVRGCLVHGADPNQRDAKGQTPMAALLEFADSKVGEREAIMLVELLRAGADPFLPDNDGVSVAEILRHTMTGQAFMKANEPFFRR